MSIAKEKDKSLLVCKDGDFLRRIKVLLLDAAFPAEKFKVSSATEATAKFQSDDRIVNIVINGSDFPGADVFKLVAEIHGTLSKRACRVLVCLDDEQFEAVGDKKEKFPKYHFVKLPLTKPKVNEAFNPISRQDKGFSPRKIQKPTKQPAKPAAPKKNVNFFETSKHVQETVESLKKLAGNRTDLEAVGHIGQRFNGIFGAFSFVEDKVGYGELSKLSRVIDDVARHYLATDKSEISEPHFNLMMDAAKASYLMLKDLRENKKINDEVIKTYKEVVQRYDAATEIERRESQSQEDIDSMLAEAGLEDDKAG